MRVGAFAGSAGAELTRASAKIADRILHHPFNPWQHTPIGMAADVMLQATSNAAGWVAAACEFVERKTRRYERPEFNLPTTTVDGVQVKVTEVDVIEKPFGNMVHFKRDLPENRDADPNLLLIAPMSGLFNAAARYG